MANTLKFGNGQWATGNGTALAYNDENANFKPLPFDFTRASSGTVVNQSGLIETVGSGIPRIDFLGNTKGALLLEPQRSNLIPYSQDFSNAAWEYQNVTINSNQIIAPDGTLTADKITDNSTNSAHRITDGNTTSSSGSFTYSIFLKKGTLTTAQIQVFNSGTASSANVDLVNGTITSGGLGVNHTIQNYGNDWFKCSISGTLSNTATTVYLYLKQKPSYIGNGDYLYAWGAQLEEGSYATSYIPTSGSAVTRVADNPFQRDDLASKNLIGNTEFTWFYDCILFIKEGGTTVAPKLINSSNNQIFVGVNIPQTGSNDLRIRHKDGTNASNTSSIPFTSGDRYKIAVKISGTTGSAYINGTNLGTFTTAAAVNYDKYSNAANNPNNIIDMRIYNTALTDAELIALTTI